MGDDAPAPRPPPPKPSMSRTLMFMMVFLTLFVLIDSNLRNALAGAAGAVFNPTIGFGFAYPVITILLAGCLTTAISSIVRHVFTNWIKTTRVNQQLAALRKAQMDALRKGNPAKVEKLRQVQTKLQQDMLDVQFAPMKSMVFTLVLFITIFAWLSAFVYGDIARAGRIYFAVPWQSNVDMRAAYVLPAWIVLYSLLALPLSQVVTRLLKLLAFRKKLAKLEAQGG